MQITPENKRWLIIGGTGLVGIHLVRRLIKSKNTVTVVSRAPKDLPQSVTHISLDLSQVSWTKNPYLSNKNFDFVVFLAYATTENENYNRAVTVSALHEIIHHFKTTKTLLHFIYVGSMVVYGMNHDSEIVNEESPKVADTEYAKNKIDATTIAMDLNVRFPITILHPTAIYDETSPRIRMYLNMLSTGYFALDERGFGINNIIHADDIARAITACSSRKDGNLVEEYIVNGECINYSSWFEHLESKIRDRKLRKLPIFFLPFCRGLLSKIFSIWFRVPILVPKYKREIYERKTIFCSNKAREHFGWVAEIKFKELENLGVFGSNQCDY